MQIGCFHREVDGYAGHIRTLTLDVAVRLVPTGFDGHGRAPDWRVYRIENAAAVGVGVEIGSGWNHDGKTGTFITVQLDCPTFPRPIRANLLRSNRSEDAHVLLWSPRLRRSKAEPSDA